MRTPRKISASAEMAAFDALPPRIRAALAECSVGIKAPEVLAFLKARGERATLDQIATYSRNVLAQERR